MVTLSRTHSFTRQEFASGRSQLRRKNSQASPYPRKAPRVFISKSSTSVARKENSCKNSISPEVRSPARVVTFQLRHFGQSTGSRKPKGQKHNGVQPQLEKKPDRFLISEGDQVDGGHPAEIGQPGDAHHIKHGAKIQCEYPRQQPPTQAPVAADPPKIPHQRQRKQCAAEGVNHHVKHNFTHFYVFLYLTPWLYAGQGG